MSCNRAGTFGILFLRCRFGGTEASATRYFTFALMSDRLSPNLDTLAHELFVVEQQMLLQSGRRYVAAPGCFADRNVAVPA